MTEFPSLQEIHKRFAQKGLVIIGITSDDADTIKRVTQRFGVTFRLMHDPNNAVALKYRVEGIPRTLLIDRKGIVRADLVGGRGLEELREELKKIGL
jgi:peroxiredoxin